MTLRLYYFPTPNGRKVSIALEEMGLPYEVTRVHIMQDEQFAPDFLRISPNGRIPALTDVDTDGQEVRIFESGAILQYLGRKSGLFYAQGEAKRTWIDAWIFWQMAGLGPMTGQANWFKRVAATPGRDPRDAAYAVHRFVREVKRLYDVLEGQLQGRDYICDDYSIADMACWPWVDRYPNHVGDLAADYPAIQAWHARIAERPAVQRAMALGMEGLTPGSA